MTRLVGCTTALCYIREWRVFPGDLEVGHSTHLHPFVPWPDDPALHQSQAGYHALHQSGAGYPAYATRLPKNHPRNPNSQCIILHALFFFSVLMSGTATVTCLQVNSGRSAGLRAAVGHAILINTNISNISSSSNQLGEQYSYSDVLCCVGVRSYVGKERRWERRGDG
ncbi:hypothetical protein E2C01_018845 [Portunus trituberculatus]|uniref:Uncharacterized protein n=1 Tax=Portunus trituberculatus TaxID=210409 RepID=A0A5B7DXP1_PORTR|nr:hypothetical protein [Portunus trituberculatus]